MRNNDTLRIGYVRNGYNEQRNICYAADYGVVQTEVRDRFHFFEKVWHRLSGIAYSMALHSFSFPHRSSVDLIHTFNAVVCWGKPWMVTYETSLPRTNKLWKPLISFAWRRLASDRCVAILALSACSRDRLLEDLRLNRPRVKPSIIARIQKKIQVLHPPQNVLMSIEDKEQDVGFDGPLRLILVGHDFYRKGGLEVLIAIDDLIKNGCDIELKIVGKMVPGDYASRAGEKEVALAEKLIKKNSEYVQALGSLPGDDVLGLLRQSHLLCLPTWGDTYGYSVLEGQAAACPAVTTDLRALPEINDSESGWLISVPKLPNGDGDLDSEEKRERFREILVKGLKVAFREAHENRELLREKAVVSLERIKKEHDPAKHAEKLKSLYSQC